MPYRRSRFCKRAFLTYTAIFSQKKQWPPLACVHPNADLDDRPAVWYNWKVRLQKIQLDGGILLSEQKTAKPLSACPVETTLTLIGDKWKVLILRDLMPGTKRFGELKKSIGSVSQKVLTAQLRDMEEKGLVNRHVYAEVPPRVEYSLTDLGKSLKPILDAMWTWGEGYKATIIN